MSPRPFHPGSPEHLLAVGLVVVTIAFVTAWGRRAPVQKAERIGRGIGIALPVYYLADSLIRYFLLGVPLAVLIPLDFCSTLFFIGSYAQLARSPVAREITLFGTFAGVIHSLITPTPAEGFPSLEFARYFACHGILILNAVYIAIALEVRVGFASLARAFLGLQVIELLVGLIDWRFGMNYMYLLAKPPSPTLFDVMGPWPWYLLSIEGVALVSFLVCLALLRLVYLTRFSRPVGVFALPGLPRPASASERDEPSITAAFRLP